MALLQRIANLFRGQKLQREIEAELRSHTEMRIEENIATGMSPEKARRDALLRFGNLTLTSERVTAADTVLHMESLARDLRYGVRQLRRSPGFALTAILTLALGVAANVVVFGVLNALLLRPLNVADADSLFQVVQQPDGYTSQSYPDYVDYRARNRSFRDLLAYRLNILAFSAGAAAEKRWAYEVSGNYFDMLKVRPQLGRVLHESDEHGPNSAPYIVLSDAFWRARFHADPHVVDTTVILNKHPFTIIGVAAQGFYGTEIFIRPDFWIPMVNEEQVNGYRYLDKRFNHSLTVVGALRPGVSPRLAVNDLNAVAHQLGKENPAADDALSARLIKPGLMGDLLGAARPFLSGMMLLALLVLVAACTNLAGIFAARAADRARELAIRLSIGSTRLRILSQVLTEALLISVIAGLVGTVLASVLLSSLSRWQPFAEFPIHLTAAADARVYAIALLLSMVSGLLPGLLPARQIWKTNAIQAMKGGAAAPSLPYRLTLRDLLLCVQIALCALLVTASLVSLRGMQRSLHAPIGFVPQGAVLAATDMHMAGYTDESALPVQRRMIEQAGRIPGVSFAGTVDNSPLGSGGSSTPVWREGSADLRPSNSAMAARYFSISPGYLQAAGTRLLAGRDFTWHDDQTKPKVVLINQTFAQKMFGKVDAVGRHFLGSDKSRYEVVGVVEDGKYESLTEDSTPAMFYPLAQANAGDTTVVVRSRMTPSETAAALNQVLASVDPSLPFTLNSWPQALAFVLFPARVATAALGVMGLLAAILAVTGVFGVAAYSVSKRLKELGIRLALGSQRRQLVRAALGRPLVLLLSGSMLGLVLGVSASSLLARLVYQATPRDPLVLIGAVVTMMLVGLIASWIPAHRALAIDPAQLLRDE
jgi:predicted permease